MSLLYTDGAAGAGVKPTRVEGRLYVGDVILGLDTNNGWRTSKMYGKTLSTAMTPTTLPIRLNAAARFLGCSPFWASACCSFQMNDIILR